MKKTVMLVLTCLLILLAAPVTLAVFGFCLPSQYEETFLGELKYKYKALRQTTGRRIIVIGGSGVAFGQYSDLMEAELPDYTVINFGMYGGLGSSVMLDLAMPYIRKGDIVIFSPEQTSQTLSLYFNSEAMWQAIDGDYRMLFELSKRNLGAMVGQFGYFAAKKYNYFSAGDAPVPEGVYSKSSFNSYGDINFEGRKQNVMGGGFDPNTPIYFGEDMISEDFVSYLNSYAQACDESGARFYYRFCPMNSRAVSVENRSEIGAYYDYLQNRLEFNIIGNPYSSLMESEWFYDTNFHLNSSGARMNTRVLVQEIKEILRDTSPTLISVPSMPEILLADEIQGDNSDENYFLYEESKGELRLVGLTEEGLKKELLTLPTVHEGVPITSFDPSLFAGNIRVKEIIVQSNITRIDNRSFDGCDSLQRLVLTTIHPEKCSVTSELLEGTDCNIYVPQQSLSAYLTNYFWSVHSSRIFTATENSNVVMDTENEKSAPVTLEEKNAKEYCQNNSQEDIPWETQWGNREGAQGKNQGETQWGIQEGTQGENQDKTQWGIQGATLEVTQGVTQVAAYEYITYKANGGVGKITCEDTVEIPQSTGHIRVNTALGSQIFEREGYVLVGWNTKADGTGENIGFGSRMKKKKNPVLYARWVKAEITADFRYDKKDGEISITKYLGKSKICAIPEQIEGLPVRRICSEAFAGAQIDTLILPPSVFAVERRAFTDSSVREIYLYDSLYYIYDESFAGCENLATLHINAATPPVYSGNYFDTFSDKFDWLQSIKDKKKIVLFSGSSGRYGYDSPAIIAAFSDYQVANMGVYAYTNALPQLMIIKTLMGEGDILLSAPEFDTIKNQFCTTNALDPLFFAMMESNYDAATLLDLKDYTKVFDSLCTYLTSRSTMGGKSYSISPSSYDDEGRHYDYETYNQYGDFILDRPNGERDELLQTYRADYTTSAFPKEVTQSMNAIYDKFLSDGIRVYFSYTPRNRSSITANSTRSARRELQAYLKENLCVPVISDIEDYLYSGVYFYLIDSHLSNEGVKMRTEQIIIDIRTQLNSE